MKKRFLLACLFVGQIVFGQTTQHIKIPGTKCSMIPPDGFVAATSFSGFQNAATGASIMVNELPGPYQTIVDGFTAEALLSRGMTLLKKQLIDFNGSKAALMQVTQPANGTSYHKQMLVFGDSKATVIVNGIYPEASKNIEPQMKDAILSIVYNNLQNEHPLEAVSFTIDTKESEFKLIRYMSGSLIYSTDGKIPTDKPTFMVANSIAKISSQNQKQYAEERLKNLPRGEKSMIKETNQVKIDNLNGYEIIANGKTKDDKTELVYQVMLFNETGDYYIMIGQAKEDFDKYLESFRKIAKTFKRK